jgi:hypothetical protein
MRGQARAQPDPNEQVERRKEQTEHQTAQQTGAERARRSGLDPKELMSERWMDTVNDLDVDRDLPDAHPHQHNVGDKLGAHASKQIGIGYISQEEYETENTKDRGRRRLMNTSYRNRGGSGSKCKGRTRERLTGGEGGDLPLMTPDLSDQLDAGLEAKRYQRSGSVGGRRFKGSTEVHVVTENESSRDFGGDSSGLMSKFTGGLLG